MPTIATWDEILETSEYQQDLAVLTRMVTNSVANAELVDESNPFVHAVASLSAVLRYYIRHSVDLKDIDRTPYMDLIKKEVGVDLPLTDAIPLVELIRENKHWYGSKGTEVLYYFIGDLVGSPISLYYPRDLIFRLDNRRSRLSGSASINGELPLPESCLGRIRDGIFWAQYTFVVNVEQAQLIENLTDLYLLLNAVHPAGTKYFLVLRDNQISSAALESSLSLYHDVVFDNYWLKGLPWPALDNNFFLSNRKCRLSQHNSGAELFFDVMQVPPLHLDSGIRRLSNSTLFTNLTIDPDKPWKSFSRLVWDSATELYVEKFSDDDSIVYENVTTNVGLKNYTVDELSPLTIRHLQHAAYDLDQQNMEGAWLYDLPEMSFI